MKSGGGEGFMKIGSDIVEGDATTAMGYPSNYEGGKELMAVHGDRKTDPAVGETDRQVMKDNPFNEHSSGGAWINGSSEAVGVNAKSLSSGGGMVSPIFGDTAKALFDFANGNCAGTNP